MTSEVRQPLVKDTGTLVYALNIDTGIKAQMHLYLYIVVRISEGRIQGLSRTRGIRNCLWKTKIGLFLFETSR